MAKGAINPSEQREYGKLLVSLYFRSNHIFIISMNKLILGIVFLLFSIIKLIKISQFIGSILRIMMITNESADHHRNGISRKPNDPG